MKILFTGGGTGGHVFPIIAICREMKKISTKDMEFYYIGPKTKPGQRLLLQEGIKPKFILAGKFRRYLGVKSIIKNFLDIFKTFIGIIQSYHHIFWIAPDVIFSKGGYGSLPPALMGKLFSTPIFLHESDIVPGLANRILNKFSLRIFTSFPDTEYFSPFKTIEVGNPTRKELLEGSLKEAVKIFDLQEGKPIILILGGSQGAQRINDVILTVLPQILKNFELIHQTGPKNYKQVVAEARVMASKELRKYYHPVPFLEEFHLKHAYKCCGLIISRAGGGSIFEITGLGKPSILIPLPESAQNHQVKNAYRLAKDNGTIVIEERNLTPHFLVQKLKNLFEDPKKLDKISQKAREFSKPQAAQQIAQFLFNYLYFDQE